MSPSRAPAERGEGRAAKWVYAQPRSKGSLWHLAMVSSLNARSLRSQCGVYLRRDSACDDIEDKRYGLSSLCERCQHSATACGWVHPAQRPGWMERRLSKLAASATVAQDSKGEGR